MPLKLRAVLHRRWAVLVLVPLLAAIGVGLVSGAGSGEPAKYRAEQTVGRELEGTGAPSLSSTAQAALFATTGRVPEVAAEELGYDGDPERLADRVHVSVDEDTLTLTFTSVARDANTAEERVDAFVTAFLQVFGDDVEEERTQALADADEQQREAQARLDEFLATNGEALASQPPPPDVAAQQERLQSEASQAASEAQAVRSEPTQAEQFFTLGAEPTRQVEDAPLRLPESRAGRAALTIPIGLLLAAGLIAVLERSQPRVDTVAEAEALAGRPVIARIPTTARRQQRAPGLEKFVGPYAEGHRALRSSLEFVDRRRDFADRRPPVVAVTSPMAAEGKTSTVAHLCLAFAEAGRRVAAIDADVRKPALHRVLGVSREPGLVTAAHSTVPTRELFQRSSFATVNVVASGPSTSLLAPVLGPLKNSIRHAVQYGAVTVVDTSPLLAANDAIEVLALADHAVLVIRAGQTTRRALEGAMALVERHKVDVVGSVLVGALADPAAPYYDYYGVGSTEGSRTASMPATDGGAGQPNGGDAAVAEPSFWAGQHSS